VIPILPTLIATPVIIKTLGNETYGLYVIVLGFTGYFFTLNVGKAVTKYVAEYRAVGEIEKISNSVSATLLFGFAIGLFSTFLIAVSAAFFVSDVLQIPAHLQYTAVIALYLGCLNILINMIGVIFQSILQGLQRFDTFMLVSNSTSILTTIAVLIAVLSGYSIVAIFFVSLAVALASAIASAILVKRILPELKFRLGVGADAWGEVWRYGVSIMAYQLFGSILLLFERSWITRQYGAEALTFYVVPMTLAIYLQTFVGSVVLAVFPVINEHLSRPDLLAELYKEATKLIFIIVAFCGMTAAVIGPVFLELWLNVEFARISYSILLIQVLTFSVVSLTMIVWQVAESFRYAWLTAAANLTWMAVGIPSIVLFSYKWNLFGVAVGRLVGVAVYIPLILYIERRFLGGVFWSFWCSLGVRISLAAAFAGCAEYLLVVGLGRSWFALVLSVPAGGITFLILLYAVRLMGGCESYFFRKVRFRDRLARLDAE
jgi:O-antigen/teichoic acid export membrane protein